MSEAVFDPARRARTLAIVSGAFDRDGEARARWIAAQTVGDAALRAEVERLLAADAASVGPLDRPLADHVAKSEDARPDPNLGREVGPFRLEALLGRGGMGSVYRAARTQGGFDQSVAVKLLRRGDDGLSRRRFAQERQILVRLQHPHIAHFLDGGLAEEGQPWYALELVEGEPITRYAERVDATLRHRLALITQVCDAVQFAHQNLVLHRDLKPANILVDRTGQVKLLDFGIAKLLLDDDADGGETLTGTGMRAYTPDYAAPEQIRGEAVSTATDLYALGVIAYELLTGQRPFRRGGVGGLATSGGTAAEAPSRALARDSGDARRAAALRGDLDTVVLTCLQPDPARRYASAAALKRDIERHLAGLPIEARPDSFAYRASKFVQRHRVAVAAATLLLLGLLVTTTVSVREAQRAERESARATAFAASVQRERDNALDEVRRQETLREHFIVVLNRATQGSEPLTRERLLALASDPNLLGRFGDVRMQAALQIALSDVFVEHGDFPRTLAMIDEIAPLLDSLPDRLRFDAEANRGEAQIRIGRLDDAAAALARAQNLLTPEQRANSSAMARVTSLKGQIARSRGDLATSVALAREAAELAIRATDASPLARGTMLGSGATAMLLAGELDEAVRFADLADRVWREAGVSANLFVRTVATQRANALFLRGDLLAAEAAILRINADDSSTESIPARAARDATQAKIVALLARPDESLALVERATRGMCDAVGAESLDCQRVRVSGIDSRALAGRPDLAQRELDALRPSLLNQLPLQATADGFAAVLALRLAPSEATLTRVLEIIPAGAPAGALPRRNAVRSLLMLAEAMRAAGNVDFARRLARAALDTAADTIDGNGMDRRLLDLWQAELDAKPAPPEALEALAAAIGPTHPFVTSRRTPN